ncbi:hypothetical protein [Parachitinimonas caeni]|uniref:DUF2007 domain-containing protein n=1 Tax=Parachitinimonas caeni TaxID=3031301 RepID=A0ABT7E0B8_9NEIS|nr:hypothetical protein [Parachitinimonas caeni]MDK2125684.1 hypothetical protein [Parachitinimonas caeni]
MPLWEIQFLVHHTAQRWELALIELLELASQLGVSRVIGNLQTGFNGSIELGTPCYVLSGLEQASWRLTQQDTPSNNH